MLSVARLRVLDEVARGGSLSAAARALNYSPSAVSQQIALLQRETGACLVERAGRGIRLTSAGRLLAEHAATIVADLRAAELALAEFVQGTGGRLRFGSFPTANATLMPRAVAAFRHLHPHVEVELAELDRDEALVEIAERRLDLALVYQFPDMPPITDESIRTIPILTDELRIMLPNGHHLVGQPPLTLDQLRHENWIQGVHHGSTMDVLPRVCRAAGFEPNIVFQTDDQLAVRGLVAAGVGIALASSLATTAVPPGVVVQRLNEPALRRTVMVALPSTHPPLPAVAALVDALHSASR